MEQLIKALSLIRIAETMRAALADKTLINPLSEQSEWTPYGPDGENAMVGLVYDDRAAIDDLPFDCKNAYPVIHAVDDKTGKILLYEDTVGVPVIYTVNHNENTCPDAPSASVIIPLYTDFSIWIEVTEDGWSLEQDCAVPIWHHPSPVIIIHDTDDNLQTIRLTAKQMPE